MDFIPESEDEVIREALSQKLDRPLANLSNNVWRDSSQTKYPTSSFHIGNSLRYKNEEYYDMMYLVDVNTNDPYSIKFIIKFLRVNTMLVTKEFLNSMNLPDIGSIKISSEDHLYTKI